MQIIPKSKCSGCSACFSACPVKAISMQKDFEGFLYPIIDEKKCTECGLCRKTCPILNNCNRKNQNTKPMCYAAWNKDELIRKESSSGGIFSVLAKHVLKNDGFVCGASFDNEKKLKHIIISDEKDLPKLRGSKYLQSEIGNVFSDIKKLLDNNKNVLFVGTPCQVAGINAFLQKKHDKLITVDVVCHGTPSPLVFDRYIKDIEKSTGKKIEKINFRDKSTGWRTYSFSLSAKDERQVHKKIIHEDIFGKGFLSNLYLKPLCTECPFASIHRHSDITLGDFWGVWDYKKDLDDDKGTSLIFVNNKKGADIFSEIENEIIKEEVPINIAQSGNLVLSMPCDRHVNREDFFKEFSMNNRNVSELISNYLNDDCCVEKNSVGILNMRLPSCNYGATLQAFALRKSIERLGYDAKIINYISDIPDNRENKLCTLGFYKFREKFIKMTSVCKTEEDLVRLNKQFSTFVVGSDQVWNYNYLNGVFKKNIGKYFLNFVIPSKNILSYAPSFAENHWKGTADEIEQIKKALENFSAISVRERDGVEICQNIFNVKAICVLDPTFLLDRKDYQEIIDNEIVEKFENKYVAYFTLDEKLEDHIKTSVIAKKVAERINGTLLNIRGHKKDIDGEERLVYNTVPAWLNYIKNSEFIITDSYHCAIFAIIFKKQFIVVARDYAGNSRFDSLLSILNIKSRFFKSIEDIQDINIFEDLINYKEVYKILNAEKEKSLNFLANSLKLSKSDKIKKEILEKELISAKLEKMQLQAESNNLQAENNNLQAEKNQLLNSKTFRYSKKVQQFLKKIGIEKL